MPRFGEPVLGIALRQADCAGPADYRRVARGRLAYHPCLLEVRDLDTPLAQEETFAQPPRGAGTSWHTAPILFEQYKNLSYAGRSPTGNE